MGLGEGTERTENGLRGQSGGRFKEPREGGYAGSHGARELDQTPLLCTSVPGTDNFKTTRADLSPTCGSTTPPSLCDQWCPGRCLALGPGLPKVPQPVSAASPGG